MNYHFTTTKAHITINGGEIAELFTPEAMVIKSSNPFKGNIDLERLDNYIKDKGKEKIAFIRMEASPNLIEDNLFHLRTHMFQANC
jgi:tryptophanase